MNFKDGLVTACGRGPGLRPGRPSAEGRLRRPASGWPRPGSAGASPAAKPLKIISQYDIEAAKIIYTSRELKGSKSIINKDYW